MEDNNCEWKYDKGEGSEGRVLGGERANYGWDVKGDDN